LCLDGLGVKQHVQHKENGIVPSEVVMSRYGYTKDRRSAFWQWAKANGLPFIKLSPRKIRFDLAAVESWERRRTVGGAR
jgi:predicted DNA-binding transcriptional regulator AlpA